MKWLQLLTVALLASLLTACPAAEIPTRAEMVTRAGSINFSETTYEPDLEKPLRSGSASFLATPETPASDYDDLAPGDVCVVT